MDGDKGIVRWCPNRSHDRFITIDLTYKILKLHEATGYVKPELFEHRRLSKHSDVPVLTAYDWSPSIDGLVAAGTRNGEVHLLRIDDDSDATIAIPVKLQRTCHAVSFNKYGLLAIGLDRVRNDPSLQIWDINHQLSDWNPAEKGWQESTNNLAEPLYRLEPQVQISSVKFFEDQPNILAVGVKAASVRIHDLRAPGQAVITFPTRCNNNLAIDYADPNYFASSSINEPTVMIWDRRATHRGAAGTMYLESVDAEDVPWGGALKLERSIQSRLNSSDYVRSLRFDRDRAGYLGVLSNAGELRVFNFRKEYIDDEQYTNPAGSPELLQVRACHNIEPPFYNEEQRRSTDDRVVSFDWITLGNSDIQARMVALRAKGAPEIILTPKLSAGLHSSLLLFNGPSMPNQPFHELPNFADPQERLQNIGPIVAHHDIVFSDPPRLEHPLTTIEDIAQAFPSSSCDEVTGLPTIANRIIHLREKTTKMINLVEQTPDENLTRDLRLQLPPTTNVDNAIQVLQDLSRLSKRPPASWWRNQLNHHSFWSAALSIDVLTIIKDVIRCRSEEGYLFDCRKNITIVADDPWLQDVWDWVAGAQEAAKDDGMVINGIDLSYLGVHSVWTRDLGPDPRKRLFDIPNEPSVAEWERAIGVMNRKAGRSKFEAVPTAYPNHRQLCLAICGFSKSSEDFDNDLNHLQGEKLFTRAAAWSLFEGDASRAVRILKAGGNDYLFIALALELRLKNDALPLGTDSSDALQAHDDPYLRAIYALIKTGKWECVVSESALPLRDRIWVALRHFNDNDLTDWLDHQMASAVASGDIESIVLSGITYKAVDVLVKYVETVGDYQTALLIASFALPLYGPDFRMDQWRAKYHDHLNTRRMFVQRAQFDVRATQRSKRRDGTTALPPAARQVTLRCVHCDSDLGHADRAVTSAPSSSITVERNPLMRSLGGIECPRCGRHLPRCAICDQFMGLPRTDRRDPHAEAAEDGPGGAALRSSLSKMLSWCLRCNHGCHLDHARAWFARHIECPMDDCSCQCGAQANPDLA